MGTLKSKISSLPQSVREELCRRMDDGQRGPELMEWLNALPEVKKVLDFRYRGIPVSDQNISAWRETGYADWQTRTASLQRLRGLTEMAASLGKNAKDIFQGSAAIAGGHVMELLEGLDLEQQRVLLQEKPETFTDLVGALTSLAQAKDAQERTELQRAKQRTSEKKLKLDQDRFERLQIEAVLKAAKSPEIQAILSSKGSNADKIAALRARMFPKRESGQN